MIAYRAAWEITKNPATTILYISSTSNLAEKQLKFIKDILTSHIYRRYWPEMVNQDEGKRERWTSTEISVDHPKRKQEGVRDPTVFTAGLTSSITGLHCNAAILDDVVVQENAYTKEGREKVLTAYSLLASIETTGASEWVVGTRYHGDDLYGKLIEMTEDLHDESGNILEQRQVYEVFQREVEDRGDGTGEYIWPRQQRADGAWFGFNQEILARKKAQYLDKSHFYSQYYNNPNVSDEEAISSSLFNYYDRKYLEQSSGMWWFKDQPLNVYASIDFAYSLNAKADYTAIAVIGVSPENDIYILDLDRFRTASIKEYFTRILKAHTKWGFRKLRAEVTIAQEAIVKELKNVYFKQEGIAISVDEYRPSRLEGSKEERINAQLKPRYENGSIWHYHGGLCQELETELAQVKPRHDDLKDAVSNAVAISFPPRNRGRVRQRAKVIAHPRFGGVAYG